MKYLHSPPKTSITKYNQTKPIQTVKFKVYMVVFKVSCSVGTPVKKLNLSLCRLQKTLSVTLQLKHVHKFPLFNLETSKHKFKPEMRT